MWTQLLSTGPYPCPYTGRSKSKLTLTETLLLALLSLYHSTHQQAGVVVWLSCRRATGSSAGLSTSRPTTMPQSAKLTLQVPLHAGIRSSPGHCQECPGCVKRHSASHKTCNRSLRRPIRSLRVWNALTRTDRPALLLTGPTAALGSFVYIICSSQIYQ